jgi:WD40 repeat protein
MKNILVLTSLIFLISCGNSQQNSTSNTNNSDAENVYIYDQETNKKLKQAEDLINNDQYNKAFPILLELAKQGNPVAQNDVGASYQYGFNGETDEEKANKLLAGMKPEERRAHICEKTYGLRKGSDKFSECVYKILAADVELEKIELQKKLTGHSRNVSAVAFSQDGNYIVTASPDKLILWGKESFEPNLE